MLQLFYLLTRVSFDQQFLNQGCVIISLHMISFGWHILSGGGANIKTWVGSVKRYTLEYLNVVG